MGLGWAVPALLHYVQLSIVQGRETLKGREILLALNAYAAEHDGRYPEGATANDAFRWLFKGGYVTNEYLFGSSYYQANGNIGTAPDFAEALAAGENGWAMTKGLSNKADPATPLICENPLRATWPPLWDAKALGSSKPGRIWPDWTVMVGRVDGSVYAERLVRTDRTTTTLRPIQDGKNLFELAGPHEILQVEE